MSDKDINQMDFKELRNEVQMLRDELAIMQRKYEDILYNLDNENFSGSIIKEKEDMKAEIKVTAEEVTSKVSSEEVKSMISQTAKEINTKISNVDGRVSSVKQSVSSLSSRVSDAEGVTSEFTQTADGFMLDGSRVKFNGVLQIVDADGNPMFSIFRDTNYGNAIYMWSYIDSHSIVIGDSKDTIYLHGASAGNEIATQGWVQENNTAKFG